MIHIHIPFTLRHTTANLKLIELTKSRPEMFKYETVVHSTYGSFANCRWNGGRYILEEQPTDEQIEGIIKVFNSLGVSFRLTFTNQFIKGKFLEDAYANKILDIASESGMNEVLLNNEDLENYIRAKYDDKFRYIKSCTSFIRDIDKFNEATEKYYLTVMDYRDNYNKEFTDNIVNKSKTEIMLNDTCVAYCKCREKHHKDIQIAILANGDESIYKEYGYENTGCPYKIDNSDIEKIAEDKNFAFINHNKMQELIDDGFCNFKIVGREHDTSYIARTYAYFFIKDEYKDEFLNIMYNIKYTDVIKDLTKYFMD